MKLLLISILTLLFTLSIHSQDTIKLPKIRAYSGLLKTRFEIGEKDAKEKQVLQQLENTCPSCYYDFRKGKNLTVWANIFAGIGLGFSLGALVSLGTSTESATSLIIIGLPFTLGSILLDSTSKIKKNKGIDKYNKMAGY